MLRINIIEQKKREIADVALQIYREEGLEGLTSRNLGKKLGSSACPIFTVFSGMDEVQEAMIESAKELYKSYVDKGLSQDIPFRGVGEQYVLFALNEPRVFQLLFMNEGEAVPSVNNALPLLDEIYLATKKIGKNNPKAEQIKADNEVRMMWNHEVDRALVSQVPENEIRLIKKEFITDRIRGSIKAWGNCPELLANIMRGATTRLALLIHDLLTAARELKNKLFHEALEKEYGNKTVIKAEDSADVVTAPAKEVITEHEPPVITITATVPETDIVEQPKPQIPPRPVIPPEAAAFPRLQKVKVTLDKQNRLIFEAERERNKLEIELSDLKGLARLTKKKELESRITTKNEVIRTLKAGLSGIVRQHGFATVQDFYTAFYTAQRTTDAYQKECAKWDEAYGEKAAPKAETMHEKIQRYKEKADRQNANRPYQSRDKGAR